AASMRRLATDAWARPAPRSARWSCAGRARAATPRRRARCSSPAASSAAQGCAQLGILYNEAPGPRRDVAMAARLFARACDGDDVLGCANLGALHSSGEGVARDPVRAAELFARGCTDATT